MSFEKKREAFRRWCQIDRAAAIRQLKDARTIGPLFRAWAILSTVRRRDCYRQVFLAWRRIARDRASARRAAESAANACAAADMSLSRAARAIANTSRRRRLRDAYAALLSNWMRGAAARATERSEEERHELRVRVAQLQRDLAGAQRALEASVMGKQAIEGKLLEILNVFVK